MPFDWAGTHSMRGATSMQASTAREMRTFQMRLTDTIVLSPTPSPPALLHYYSPITGFPCLLHGTVGHYVAQQARYNKLPLLDKVVSVAFRLASRDPNGRVVELAANRTDDDDAS